MELVAQILPYAQIILGVLLTMSILLQHSGASTGGALGGGNTGSFHSTRRGFEKFLFILSIITSLLFVISAILVIIIKAQA